MIREAMDNPPPPPPPAPPPGGYAPPPQMPPPPPTQYGGGYAPQAYAPAQRYGGFWIRVVAYIIDGILIGIVGAIIDIIFHANPNDPQSAGYTTANAINFLLGAAYFIVLWTVWGASIGQRLLKLRIVDANTNAPIGVGKAILRYIGLVVSFLVCLIGVIWVAFDARKQGWMDKIAGTVVLQA
jgi:uncharacterized RDD family membrane protein YckC